MSKNFDVLTQTEEAQAGSKRATASMPVSKKAYSSNDANRRWIDEETLSLVQRIFLLQTQEPPRMVVFSGIDHGNGCSRICATVAEILAKNSRRPVCLVDANFRSPSLAAMFGASTQQGLTEALMQEGPISSFARPVDGNNLWLLSSGAVAPDSPNLFALDGLKDRLLELRRDFDFVVIDTPPLSKYSDALVLGQHSEGLVLVLEADSTRMEAASDAVSNLRAANVPILAAVLNKRTYPIPEMLAKFL